MQPHLPFLSELGQSIEPEVNKWGRMHRPGPNTSAEEVRQAYKENLELALEEVYKLNQNIAGKVAVTSDHGELLGERERPIPVKQWGHHSNLPFEKLLNVPWHELAYSERREITSDKPEIFEVSDELDQRLAAFGYK